MTFLPNIPNPGDLLSFSQGQLLSNNQGLDAIFGIDHFPFSNATANKGYHAVTHWPDQTPPSSSTTSAIQYGAKQAGTNLPIIEYALASGTNICPSPITYIQSPTTPITLASAATTNVLDCTGITQALFVLYAMNVGTGATLVNSSYEITWNGSANAFKFNSIVVGSSTLLPKNTGNIIQILNGSAVTYSNIYWTLQCLRLQ